jgi:hypothetical protein
MSKRLWLLTAAGIRPALMCIRGFGKSHHQRGQCGIIGFRDGFTGLVEDRTLE